MLVHASCVLWQNKGILFLGDSGTGKSTASLRLIEKGATLVADDYVDISPNLIATCPENTFGKIEVRGVGIVSYPAQKETPLHLVIQCTKNFKEIERIPIEKKWENLPLFTLCPFDNLFVLKVDLLLKNV